MRRVLMVVCVLACAGFSPVSGCAKGCKACAGSGDDFARVSARSSDDFARASSRSVDDLARAPRPHLAPAGGLGESTVTRASLDDAVATLPETTGSMSPLAHAPSSRGATLVLDAPGRSFGGDYARTLEQLGLSRSQHERLLDVFDHAQDVVELIGEVAGGDDDKPRLPLTAEQQRTLRGAARKLQAQLELVLEPAQLEQLMAVLGSPIVIAYRLATERPIVRKTTTP